MGVALVMADIGDVGSPMLLLLLLSLLADTVRFVEVAWSATGVKPGRGEFEGEAPLASLLPLSSSIDAPTASMMSPSLRKNRRRYFIGARQETPSPCKFVSRV